MNDRIDLSQEPFPENHVPWWSFWVSSFVINIIGGVLQHIIGGPLFVMLGGWCFVIAFVLFWVGVVKLVAALRDRAKKH